MVNNVDISISYHGPIFQSGAGAKARQAAKEATVDELVERIMRTPKRVGRGSRGNLGRRVNRLERHDKGKGGLVTEISTTLRAPRNKGTSWQRYNSRLARRLLPSKIRKAQNRITQELS